MKIKKHIIFSVLSIVLVFSATNANAWITFDAVKGVGKVFSNISHFAKKIQEEIVDLQNKILGQKWLQDGMSAAKYFKSTYSANANMISQYYAIYNSAMNSDAVVLARMNAEVSSLNRAIEDLEAQKASLTASYENTRQTQEDLIDGQIDTIKNNNIVYTRSSDPESQSAIESNNEEIEKLNSQRQKIAQDIQSNIDASVAVIDDEISNLETIRDGIKNDIARMSSFLVTDYLSDVAALTASHDLNFVYANKELTTKEIERVKTNRQKERDDVSKEVFAKTISLKSVMSPKTAQAVSFAKLNNGFEEVSSNIITLTESKISQSEDLLIYVELMLLDLKMQVSQDLAISNVYTSSKKTSTTQSGSEVTAAFNLDDYVFDYEEYKDEQLKNQPTSIRTIYRNAKDAQYAIEYMESEIKGGAKEEFKDFANEATSSSNAGYIDADNNNLEKLEQNIDYTEQSVEKAIEDNMNLFKK